MAGYLASTYEKVEAIVKAAPREKVDPRRVELVSLYIFGGGRAHMMTFINQAMKPVLDAVDKALAFQRSRTARGGTPNPQTPR